jgi:hypothetical protein
MITLDFTAVLGELLKYLDSLVAVFVAFINALFDGITIVF